MHSKVASQFPTKKTFLNETASLELSNPKLETVVQQERLAAEFNYRASLLGQRPISGTLRIQTALVFHSADHSLRLRNVKLESLTSNLQVPGWVQSGLQLAAEQAIKSQLEDYNVYQLKPSQLTTLTSLGLSIGSPRIQANGLYIPLIKKPTP